MLAVKTFVSTIFHGLGQSYIYIWVSKSERIVYVGQTNERFGSFGRGYAHIQKNGTLRVRCNERAGLELEQISDLHLFSYPLPAENEFTSVESSFRLAVEYLVQYKLYERRTHVTPSFQIISNIATNERTNNSKVKELAELIVTNFISDYTSL